VYDWILRHWTEAPLAVVAVLLFYFASSLRQLKNSVMSIRENMIAKHDFEALAKEVNRIKEEQVWKDMFVEVIESLKDRLVRIEDKVFNGGGGK